MRFNLLLPKNLYEFLERASNLQGVSKAQCIRVLIEDYFEKFSQTSKPFKKNWSFSQNISFNFSLNENLYSKIDNLSKIIGCTKGEIIRYVLFLESNKNLNGSFLKIFPQKEEVVTNPIFQKINFLFNQKRFEELDSYLNSFIFNGKENGLLNIGKPKTLVDIISVLENNYEKFNPAILFFKAKMSWYQGKPDEALDTLDRILNKYSNPQLRIRTSVLKSDILIDKGDPFDSQEILYELLEQIDKENLSYYRVKIYNKLGLSFFYTDNLDKTKKYYEQALNLATRDEEIAIANRYLGSIYFNLENINLSEEYFRKSLESFEKNSQFNVNEYSKLLITYAEVKASQSDWINAEKLASRGLSLIEKIQNLPNLAWGNRIISNIYYNLGEEFKAHQFIDKSMEVAKQIGGSSFLAYAYRIKGKYHLANKNFSEGNKFMSTSRFFEKKLCHNSTYNTAVKWLNYLSFFTNKNIDFGELHKQSDKFKATNYVRAETTNDYVMGFLYLNSEEEEKKSIGKAILKRLLFHSIENGDRQIQFAIESALRFNQFTIV